MTTITYFHYRTCNLCEAMCGIEVPHHFAVMFGHQLLLPIPDIDHTDCFLMLDANPLASKGVVGIPHGFGHTRKGAELDIATQPQYAGVSINDLTDDQAIDSMTGNAAFSATPVRVVMQG